jgi:hypothetical protein
VVLVDEYRREPPAGFASTTRREYAGLHGLDPEQMAWRRAKIAELKDPLLFMQEYPATAAEAFQATATTASSSPAGAARPQGRHRGDRPAGDRRRSQARGIDRFSIAWRKGRKVC